MRNNVKRSARNQSQSLPNFWNLRTKCQFRNKEYSIWRPPLELFRGGRELYDARQDKKWGLTDWISFVTMRDWRIQPALTTDCDFEQAGFTAVLRLCPWCLSGTRRAAGAIHHGAIHHGAPAEVPVGGGGVGGGGRARGEVQQEHIYEETAHVGSTGHDEEARIRER